MSNIYICGNLYDLAAVRDWPLENGWMKGPKGELVIIKADARVGDRAWVGDRACVGDRAWVGADAWVGDRAWVGADACVGDRAWVGADACVGDRAWVATLTGVRYRCSESGVRNKEPLVTIGCQEHTLKAWGKHFNTLCKHHGVVGVEKATYKAFLDMAMMRWKASKKASQPKEAR